jgi:hypothetical protein
VVALGERIDGDARGGEDDDAKLKSRSAAVDINPPPPALMPRR